VHGDAIMLCELRVLSSVVLIDVCVFGYVRVLPAIVALLLSAVLIPFVAVDVNGE